jgi:AcrR family transcriptional regulator
VRSRILAAAEHVLLDVGVDALTVRAVATRVGMTDMGVNHHFRSRDELVLTLLKHLGARYRSALAALVADWVRDGSHLLEFVDRLAEFYESGHEALVASLWRAGWREPCDDVLEPVARALHCEARGFLHGGLEQAKIAVALMHQIFAVGESFGADLFSSAGLHRDGIDGAEARRSFWSAALQERPLAEGAPSLRSSPRGK